MTVVHVTLTGWVLLLLGAALVGFAKAAVGGAGALAVTCFATAVPARASTGLLLPCLLVGDVIAVRLYHRHADWRVLLKLLPAVLPGLLLGSLLLAHADDAMVRRLIGLLLASLCALHLMTRSSLRSAGPRGLRTSVPAGMLAGFATQVANAAGPVTTLYLVRSGLPVLGMLGTTSWFFLVVNAAKVPLSVHLGLLSWSSLMTDAALLPALAAGMGCGVALIGRIDAEQFETASVILAGIAALLLLQ